jgi:hypothetical protein
MDAPAPDHYSPMFLLKALSRPAIEDMNLPCSSGTNFIVVSPFVSGWKSGKGAL